MPRMIVLPGRARINLKIWRTKASTELAGELPEDVALAIYRIASSGKVPDEKSEDNARLDWLIVNHTFRVRRFSDGHWEVIDSACDLQVIAEGKTSREAIDVARVKTARDTAA